jgi:hypothetical protein
MPARFGRRLDLLSRRADTARGREQSWYGFAMALNKRGIPTATGRGIWEPAQVQRMMERLK